MKTIPANNIFSSPILIKFFDIFARFIVLDEYSIFLMLM